MKNYKKILAPLLFSLFALLSLGISITKPAYNWDMIPYIACAKSFEDHNPKDLYLFAFDQTRRFMPKNRYNNLINESNYNHSTSVDSSAFSEQLPFYQIRPIYNIIVFLFYKTTLNIVFASYFVSGLAIFISIFFLYLLSNDFLPEPYIYAIPIFGLAFNMLDLARTSTPDGLAFLATIIAAYIFLEKNRKYLFLILPLMIGVRTDLVILITLILTFSFFQKKIKFMEAFFLIFLSLLIYIGINHFFHNPGYSSIFYFTLIKKVSHPISESHTLTINEYFRVLLIALPSIFKGKILIYLLISVTNIFLFIFFKQPCLPPYKLWRQIHTLNIICFLYVILHFFSFPSVENRWFSAEFMLGAFSLLTSINAMNYMKNRQC